MHHDVLISFALYMGRKKARVDGKYFQASEDLFELFAVSVGKFLSSFIPPDVDLAQFVRTNYKVQPQLCAVVACYVFGVVPYFAMRSLARAGIRTAEDGTAMLRYLAYWLPYFHTTSAWNYMLLTFRWLLLVDALLPSVRSIVLANLTASVSGRPDSCQAIDLLGERVRGGVSGRGVCESAARDAEIFFVAHLLRTCRLCSTSSTTTTFSVVVTRSSR